MVPPPDNMGDEFPDFDKMSLEEQMAWLESLAKRQGASEEELTTDADLDVPIPENAEELVDEPGYVPFEGSRSAREMQEAQAEELAAEAASPPPAVPEAAPVVEEEAPPEIAEVSEAVAEPSFEETFAAEEAADAMQWLDELSVQPEEAIEPVAEEAPPETATAGVAETLVGAADEAEELLGGAESLEWMESLAKRQGASEEELITAADVNVPEVPEETVIEEPGYTPYSALDILPPNAPEKAAISEAASAGEDLSWLEDLAAEPDEEDFVASLATEEEEGAETLQFETIAPETPEAAAPTDPLGDMSDEEIARAQAEGRLTPEQEFAWLKRQARALAAARETQDTETAGVPEAELPPAEPVELPGWLEELRATEEMEALSQAETLLDAEDVNLESEALPDWLQASEEAAPSEVVEVSLEEASDVESLWQEPDKASAETAELEEALPDSELAAFLSGDFAPEAPDTLAEALDEEYERRVTGDDTEPEWYAEAVNKVTVEEAPLVEAVQAPEAAPEASLQEAEPLDMPDWLRGEEEEAPAAVTLEPAKAEEAMPDWLAEEAEVPVAEPEAAMPDWLQDLEPSEEQAAAGALDWLAEEPKPETLAAPEEPAPPAPVAAPEVETLPPAPPVAEKAPRPQPSIPEGKLLEQYLERLKTHPDDYPTRLSLARSLRTHEDIGGCLDHYEALIGAGQLLQDVTEDLKTVVEDNPEMPRAQRLLGDAYMRQGMLSEALTAYRQALAQL